MKLIIESSLIVFLGVDMNALCGKSGVRGAGLTLDVFRKRVWLVEDVWYVRINRESVFGDKVVWFCAGR